MEWLSKVASVAKKETFGCVFLAEVAKPRPCLDRHRERHGVAEKHGVCCGGCGLWLRPLPCPSVVAPLCAECLGVLPS